jgi:hypothetical protein
MKKKSAQATSLVLYQMVTSHHPWNQFYHTAHLLLALFGVLDEGAIGSGAIGVDVKPAS